MEQEGLRLPRRTWRWFLPVTRVGWVLFWVSAACIAFWVAIFAADGNFAAGALFTAFGLVSVTSGFTARWIPVLGRLGRALDRQPGGMQRFQDTRGHVEAVGGTSAIVGSMIGVFLGWLF